MRRGCLSVSAGLAALEGGDGDLACNGVELLLALLSDPAAPANKRKRKRGKRHEDGETKQDNKSQKTKTKTVPPPGPQKNVFTPT